MTADHTIRLLTEDDLPALYRIRQIAFLDNISPTSAEAQAWHRRTLPYKYGRFVDGELAACVSWYPDTMFLDGRPQTVAGLASVVSAAAGRRRGHVRALMAHGLQMLRDAGITWCLEYPFDTRYYRQFGWETVQNGYFFEVPIERFAGFGSDADVRRMDPTPETVAHLDSIYRAWAARYNFTISRDQKIRDDWQNVLQGVPWRPGVPRFVFASDDAYCVLALHEERGTTRVHVVDHGYRTSDGRADIFALLHHFAGQASVVRLQLPSDDPLVLEWSNFMVAHPNPLQARVVDAARALTGWRCAPDFALTLQIRDDFCPWNHATFAVRADANATTLAQETPATTSDLTLDIRALAQLLSGAITAHAAAHTGLVSGAADAIAQLAALNSRPSFMSMADYF